MLCFWFRGFNANLLWTFSYQEVEAREAEVGKIKTEVNSIDGRLNKTEVLFNYINGMRYDI